VETLGLGAAALAYLWAYVRVRPTRTGWPWGRVVSCLAGLAAVAVALLPPLADHDEVFELHVAQHLLLGMAAPLLLALSAPVTLALRALPAQRRRRAVRMLHARPLRLASCPATAAVLAVVPMYLLYLTPLYGYAAGHPLAHDLLHLHFLAAGCLFAWATVGTDPLPGRDSFRVRGAVLALAFAAHATLAKLIYAAGPAAAGEAGASVAGWHRGAELMWYGGDAGELSFAVVLALQWYRLEGRRLARRRPAPA
jgi:putative membrane protein